jgi:hypothetical protein
MTFCLISRHEGINNGCARRNGQVASRFGLVVTLTPPPKNVGRLIYEYSGLREKKGYRTILIFT